MFVSSASKWPATSMNPAVGIEGSNASRHTVVYFLSVLDTKLAPSEVDVFFVHWKSNMLG